MECKSTLFVKNHIPYLWDLSNSFSNSFIDFYCCEGFQQVIYQKEWSIKLRNDNDGWHETLNLLHVSRCEMLLVTSYTKQNKSHKQTLERAQYGLGISFNLTPIAKPPSQSPLCLTFIQFLLGPSRPFQAEPDYSQATLKLESWYEGCGLYFLLVSTNHDEL